MPARNEPRPTHDDRFPRDAGTMKSPRGHHRPLSVRRRHLVLADVPARPARAGARGLYIEDTGECIYDPVQNARSTEPTARR